MTVIPHPNAESWEDADIRRLARTDRRLALDLMVRKYRSRLYYHALCIVKEPQEARDAVQEVFIRAMHERRFFEQGFQVKAWLFRVTSNLCYNIVRDRRRRSVLLESRAEEATPQPASIRSAEVVQEHQVRDQMLRTLERLTPSHREILILRYYDDLSYREIAEILDVKLGTVMSRLSRARARLAGLLDAEHPLVTEEA